MNRVTRIHSKNSHFLQIEAIKNNRQKRRQHKSIFVEGVSPINCAIRNGWGVKTLICSELQNLSDWAQGVIKAHPEAQCFEVGLELMQDLSDKNETSELIVLVEMNESALHTIEHNTCKLVALFDRPSSPGNLGSSLRSADAFGVDLVIISGHAVDPYDPQVIRSSIGTVFSVPIVQIESHRDLTTWLERSKLNGYGYQVVGTSALADSSIADLRGFERVVCLFGNEKTGLSKAYREISNVCVKIPIEGEASSLNVSCAASIVFYHLRNLRH